MSPREIEIQGRIACHGEFRREILEPVREIVENRGLVELRREFGDESVDVVGSFAQPICNDLVYEDP